MAPPITMTKAELIKALEPFPDDMEVKTDGCHGCDCSSSVNSIQIIPGSTLYGEEPFIYLQSHEEEDEKRIIQD